MAKEDVRLLDSTGWLPEPLRLAESTVGAGPRRGHIGVTAAASLVATTIYNAFWK